MLFVRLLWFFSGKNTFGVPSLGLERETSTGLSGPLRLRVQSPKDPDILKTVRVVNLLSVVNLLRVVIHY